MQGRVRLPMLKRPARAVPGEGDCMEGAFSEMEYGYALLKKRLEGLMPRQGRYAPRVEGVTLFRGEESVRLESAFCPPSVGVTVQGFQEAVMGVENHACGTGDCLLNCVGMPCSFLVREACREKPFFSMALELRAPLLFQLMAEVPCDTGAASPPSESALRTAKMTPELLYAFVRLAEAAKDEIRAKVLAPMIVREIHFYLLTGPFGACLRNFYTPGTPAAQIAQAIGYMRARCRERLRMEVLARMANMAESTFSRNFRRVTSLSPLQFHKRLKLYEARRLMTLERCSAADACFAVGYESRPQFTREYKRLFGRPPLRDIMEGGGA